MDNPCTVQVRNESIASCKFLNKAHGNNKTSTISIPCNPYTLERQTPFFPTNNKVMAWENMQEVLITDWDIKIIQDLVESEEYKKDLTKALLNNKFPNHTASNTFPTSYYNSALDHNSAFEFYTDGSLINRGAKEEETKMGAAWLQSKGPTPSSNFVCGVQNWPSSCRAEATAILIAILTVPREKVIKIYTDSQNCIDTFKKVAKIDPKLTTRRWLKINN